MLRFRLIAAAAGLFFFVPSMPPATAEDGEQIEHSSHPPARSSVEVLPLESAPVNAQRPSMVSQPEPPKAAPGSDQPTAAGEVVRRQSRVSSPAVALDQKPPDLPADLGALRAETAQWLSRLDASATPAPAKEGSSPEQIGQKPSKSSEPSDGKGSRSPSASTSGLAAGAGTSSKAPGGGPRSSVARDALRETLVERQLHLDEHDQAVKELEELGNPQSNPQRQAAAARAELERLEALTSQPAESLQPRLFRTGSKELTDALRSEMKDAIDATQGELKDWQTKLHETRAGAARAALEPAALQAQRDKQSQQVAALRNRGQEYESAWLAAKTAAVRRLARERLINFRLEVRVEEIRLRIVEAKLARAVKLSEARQLDARVAEAHCQLARKVLDQMQMRYREASELKERALEQAAAKQENRARQAEDPLERYRARCLAEMLELEAKIIKFEQAPAALAHPALEEERALADRAEADFAQIKQLLDDGNVSRLDALRLNNDFRRIGPERDRLLKSDLTSIEEKLQYYENTLTSVELELIEDSLVDQVEHDAVLERLASERHAEARSQFAELERKHKELLVRQKAALTRLVTRSAETLEQVTRRLRILEDEYGFIRTHIFWVRDQVPMGLSTLQQGGRELKQVAKGLLKLASESGQRKSWSPPSSEFLAAAAAALILPLGLFRLRRTLRRRITRALPPSHLHGENSRPIRVEMSDPRPGQL
jgi:hypothetical protein